LPYRPHGCLFQNSGVSNIATDKPNRINGEITVPEVRLIGVEGEQLGIVKIAEAVRLSEQNDVDLVEIAPTAQPPVCRLMDYGKFKYQEQKRQHEAKLKQRIIQVKEVKFRPGTDEGDYQVKLRNLKRFLEEGDKAKVTLRFRGREMAHQELGMRVLERVRDDLLDVSAVEAMPKLEGRQMVMVLAPKKKVLPAGKTAE
jgi:translation initiation factor IF-3